MNLISSGSSSAYKPCLLSCSVKKERIIHRQRQSSLSNCPSCAFFSLLARITDNHRHTLAHLSFPRPKHCRDAQAQTRTLYRQPHITRSQHWLGRSLFAHRQPSACLSSSKSTLCPFFLALSSAPPSHPVRSAALLPLSQHKVFGGQLHNYTIWSTPPTPLRVSHRRLPYIPYIIYERHPARFSGKAPLRHRQHPALTAQPLYICGSVPRDCVDSIAPGSKSISCACLITPKSIDPVSSRSAVSSN